jgi:phosphate transport system permease protein
MSATTREEPLSSGSLLPAADERRKLRKKRAFRDAFSRYGVGSSGIGVIIALALIFVYLFYETFPLLKPVSVELETEFSVPGMPIARPPCT